MLYRLLQVQVFTAYKVLRFYTLLQKSYVLSHAHTFCSFKCLQLGQNLPGRSIAWEHSGSVVPMCARRLGQQLTADGKPERHTPISCFRGSGAAPHSGDRPHVIRWYRVAVWTVRTRVYYVHTQRRRQYPPHYTRLWGPVCARSPHGLGCAGDILSLSVEKGAFVVSNFGMFECCCFISFIPWWYIYIHTYIGHV